MYEIQKVFTLVAIDRAALIQDTRIKEFKDENEVPDWIMNNVSKEQAERFSYQLIPTFRKVLAGQSYQLEYTRNRGVKS